MTTAMPEAVVHEVVPTGDRVLIKRADPEEVTAGGIVLPSSSQIVPTEGIVLAVGKGLLKPDGTRSDFEIAPGDQVLFTEYAGTPVTVAGVECLIMPENDVLAVLRLRSEAVDSPPIDL